MEQKFGESVLDSEYDLNILRCGYTIREYELGVKFQ